MAIVISSTQGEKVFRNKDVISIGTNPNCDVILNTGYDVLLTLEYNTAENKCVIINTFKSDKVLFKGQPIKKVEVASVCKLMFANTDEFISVKLIAEAPVAYTKTVTSIGKEDLTEDDIKGLYGKDVNAVTKVKLEKQKEDLENARVAIIKQVAFHINDLKQKLSTNSKTSIFLHVAMFLSSMVCAFGVSNYLMGLTIKESANFLHLPTNIKVWGVYTILIYGICLLLKQGIYLYLQSNIQKEMSKSAKLGQSFMLIFSLIFVLGIYVVNLVYYMNLNDFMTFAIFISFFFSGIMAVLAISCGYFKCNGMEWTMTLDKYEYKEDFESVIKSLE